MKNICVIAAASRNGVIGKEGEIPWYIPDDLKYFKTLTAGCPVIMGRKTYESIGKALPGRPTIVVSNTLTQLPDAQVVNCVDDAIVASFAYPGDDVFVIGGAGIYKTYIDHYATSLFLTSVDLHIEGGDAIFPYIEDGKFNHPQWKRVMRVNKHRSEDNAIGFAFEVYSKTSILDSI